MFGRRATGRIETRARTTEPIVADFTDERHVAHD